MVVKKTAGNVHARSHLPRLLATLTANALRDLLAVVPGGTGTIGAAAWAIETVVCGAFAVRRWVEPAVAEAGRMGPWYSELVRATVRDRNGLSA